MAEHFEWLPVAAPEIGGRISNGDDALNADDLREVADSYDLSYRAASLISGYDPAGGGGGPAHFTGAWLPEAGAIRALTFVEDSQELEAEIEITERFRQLFMQGFRTPSVGLVKFPDHPSGEARLYCQHVALVGPGEIEIIAGLGGERWEERLRSFNADLAEIGDSLRSYKFRALTTEEMKMPDSKADEKSVHEDEDEEKKSSEDEKKKRSADTKPASEEKSPLIRAVETDPLNELREQVSQIAAQNRAMATENSALADTVASFVEAAGDPGRVRAAAEEVESLRDEMRIRAAADQEEHIRREVEALASGDEPRMRNAETDFAIKALLAMDPADAETELTAFRARDPIATDLGTRHLEDEVFQNLPEGFNLDTYRNANGAPSQEQLRQYSQLSAEGKGNPVAAAIARERSAKMRSIYNG